MRPVPPTLPYSMSSGRFDKYKSALKSISVRTGAPLPSLILSFAILHELTAAAPLVGGFYTARALGVGETIVNAVQDSENAGWIQQRMKIWLVEGEGWAERVGRRYGYFGFEKRDKLDKSSPTQPSERINIAGDIANAVVAYGAVKVCLYQAVFDGVADRMAGPSSITHRAVSVFVACVLERNY